MAQVESNVSVDIPRNMHGLPNNLAMTPGGTLFGTTPGGTRIIYDRNYLLKFRSSPVAKTPPTNLPFIVGVTNLKMPPMKEECNNNVNIKQKVAKSDSGEDNLEEPQFSMEM